MYRWTRRIVAVAAVSLSGIGCGLSPNQTSQIGTAKQKLDTDCFITAVVSFTPGRNAGFGQDRMPDIVYGPPVGTGDLFGSLDVVSLGDEGEIIVELGHYIMDGPGPDFIVFENPFYIGGDPTNPFAEPGEVSVSEDGKTWTTFPCVGPFECDINGYPYGSCAGWHPIYSNPDNGISPFDPVAAGGDVFDLADIGVKRAKFIRIRDMNRVCSGAPSAGFDLDAISIINAEDADCPSSFP
jgi:hypothetical protein